ncbi:hypothetical protein V2J09_010321 [Rumex salicifolius]
MASRRKLPYWVKWLLIIAVCFLTCATTLASKSVKSIASQTEEEMKMVLGSRPPRCTNRCRNCRPCMAVLVIPPHKKTNINHEQESSSTSTTSSSFVLVPQEEENYYLLSWKCRCKNKFFQP